MTYESWARDYNEMCAIVNGREGCGTIDLSQIVNKQEWGC
ncbi:hypothetical protein VCHA53O466_50030 [Vibrio chagasii]|nr:hypothetical protein VCHA53O466_50030 [Vibrio chagasii]